MTSLRPYARSRRVPMVLLAGCMGTTVLLGAHGPISPADRSSAGPTQPAAIGRTATTISAAAITTAAPPRTTTARASAPARLSLRPSASPYRFASKRFNQWYAKRFMQVRYHWYSVQYRCLTPMWGRESAWNERAHNGSSGAQGIPQAVPGSKMASFGRDWRTNPMTQIKWGLHYIKAVYGTPCRAWAFWRNHHWY